MWRDRAHCSCRACRTERRFRELAAKEALGTITPAESVKLDRYTQLRRSLSGFREPREALVDQWRARIRRKAFARLYRQMAGLPTT
jgi:hypothetical protein